MTGPSVSAEGQSHPDWDPVETVQVRDYMVRAFAEYNPGMEPCGWVIWGAEDGDPESWTKVAGNYGPVKVVTP